MKTDKELKIAIQQAIHQFDSQPVHTAALALLDTIGYRSQKTMRLDANTAAEFRSDFDRDGRMNPEKALLDDWKTVDLLFQLTDEEVKELMGSQAQLFVNRQVEQTLIESYLFFAIELTKEKYSRTQLAGITREINRLFPMPVMLLFKHNDCLSISIITRRVNKRDASKDVLEKVTLIKDIAIHNPKRAHLEILADLSFDVMMERQPFGNFVELQKAWEKTLDTAELNKKFYREVADWYFWAVRKVHFPDDGGADGETRRSTAVIRLITRLIFVWFIKEKGLVPEALFDERALKEILNYADPKGSTYYKAILQNLFFATLNTEMGGKRQFRAKYPNSGRDGHYGISTLYRYEDYFKDSKAGLQLFAGIPFLNGGLFECLDKRDVKPEVLVDGFSEIAANQPIVPDELFFGTERNLDLSDEYGDTKRKSERVRGLIRIFDSYKFTIEENTPVEEEIALDPELLGKVFENLLAAYNPETGTTARKQTGSFYTPREIVNYMVDESLIAYLETALGEGENIIERLRHLLAYNEEAHQFEEAETQKLIAAIDSIKVLDPACGSGAFPMGVLHKLVFILGKLDPDNTKWREVQRQKAIRETEDAYRIGNQEERQQRLIDIDETFENNAGDFGRKLYLIENCIYGVDIQPIAVQIAKLRFFISLVVEQTVDIHSKNQGILPLPNLETKFVAANSLIGIERPSESQRPIEQSNETPPEVVETAELLLEKFRQYLLVRNPDLKESLLKSAKRLGDEINQRMAQVSGWAVLQVEWVFSTATKLEELRNLLPLKKAEKATALQLTSLEIVQLEAELKEVRSKIFRARTHDTKKKYRQTDKQIRTKIAHLLVKQGWESTNAEKLAGWDPFDQNSSADFFDPEWMFAFQDGFDITIGNPPYVQLQSMGEKADELKRMGYETFARMGDLYCLFYEKGFQLLRPKGILAFITSNKWMRAGYGEALRKFFASYTNPLLLIDFSGQKIFESVTVDVNILISEKSSNKSQTRGCIIQDKGSLNNLSDFIEQQGSTHQFNTNQSWSILSNIEQQIKSKIETIGIPLGNWDVSINRGILTGLNEAFIITDQKRNELVSLDPKSAEIIRPILRGRDIKRYGYEYANLFLICTFPSKKYNIDEFPAIKSHLLSYGYERLEQSGKSYWNNDEKILSRKKTNNKWFETQDSISYWDDFYKQKIVWGNLCLSAQYAMAENGIFINAPSSMIVPGNEYLLAVLNSKLADWFIRTLGVTRNGGYFEYKPMFVKKLPVPPVNIGIDGEIKRLINQLHELKRSGQNTLIVEEEIDDIVFNIYCLSNHEREFVLHSQRNSMKV